jgi:hypothetical protein
MGAQPKQWCCLLLNAAIPEYLDESAARLSAAKPAGISDEPHCLMRFYGKGGVLIRPLEDPCTHCGREIHQAATMNRPGF